MQKLKLHSSTGLDPVFVFANMVVVLAGLLWSGGAQANDCSVSLNGISSAAAADPGTPRLAEVQSLYERGSEAHEIQLALARSLRCQLGIVGESQQRPESIASLRTAYEAQVAQARAKQDAEERRRASSQGFWSAVGAVTNVINAVGSGMRGAQQSAPSGPQDNCGWVPRPGGGGYCELGHGG